MRRFVSLLALALIAGGLVSCGGSSAAGPGGGGGGGGGGVCTVTFCMTSSNTFSPRNATITAGSTATWSNDSGQGHNVLFDTPSEALPGDAAGDIPEPATGTHTRKFNTPGVYPFHCNIHPGMNGTLTVN